MDELKQAKARIVELEEELRITDLLLNDREKLLLAIPRCPVHGPCIPHALEWVERVKNFSKLCKG